MVCPHCGCEIQIPDGSDVSDDFAVFWSSYPKHKAKADAEKAWRQTLKVRPKLGVLLDAIEAQKMTRDWVKDGGAFVPLAGTWLRGKRWLDEVSQGVTTSRTVAERMPTYDGEWCHHDPKCPSRDWHEIQVEKERA